MSLYKLSELEKENENLKKEVLDLKKQIANSHSLEKRVGSITATIQEIVKETLEEFVESTKKKLSDVELAVQKQSDNTIRQFFEIGNRIDGILECQVELEKKITQLQQEKCLSIPQQVTSTKQTDLNPGSLVLFSEKSIYLLGYQEKIWRKLAIEFPDHSYGRIPGIVFLNGEIYIFGGWQGKRPLKLTRSMKWEPLRFMNKEINIIQNSAAVLDGCIWVWGKENWKDDQVMEKYDPVKNTWTLMPNPSYNRSNGAIAVANNKLFIAGGDTARVEYFDPKSNEWNTFPSIPFGREGLALVSDGSNLIALGGQYKEIEPDYDMGTPIEDRTAIHKCRNMWKINVEDDSKEWQNLSMMNESRSYFSATRWGNEIIVIDRSGSVEIFSENYWKQGPNLPECIKEHSTVVVPQHFAGTMLAYSRK